MEGNSISETCWRNISTKYLADIADLRRFGFRNETWRSNSGAVMKGEKCRHESKATTRVGAAQDLAELDMDLAAITQAGGWKSTRMPLQYAEKINAARSAMARAAAATGRDESVSEER
jgi:hypothetical protein